MIRGFNKGIIDKGPVPLKVAVSWHMCRLCVRVGRYNGRAFSVMRSPPLGRFSGRKGRIWESGRNKMKGQSDQTSQTLATRTPVFLVSNSAI